MKVALDYMKNLDQRFWFNQALASVILFVLTGADHPFNLIVFPVAVALLLFITTFYVDLNEWKKYLGFSTRVGDTMDLVISLFVNFLLWQMTSFILLFALLFVWLKDSKRI